MATEKFCKDNKPAGHTSSAEECSRKCMADKQTALDGGLNFSWAPAAEHGHCYCCTKASTAYVTPNLNKDLNTYT